jgi:hypothetical protein
MKVAAIRHVHGLHQNTFGPANRTATFRLSNSPISLSAIHTSNTAQLLLLSAGGLRVGSESSSFRVNAASKTAGCDHFPGMPTADHTCFACPEASTSKTAGILRRAFLSCRGAVGRGHESEDHDCEREGFQVLEDPVSHCYLKWSDTSQLRLL